MALEIVFGETKKLHLGTRLPWRDKLARVWQLLFNNYVRAGGSTESLLSMIEIYERCRAIMEPVNEYSEMTLVLFGVVPNSGIALWVQVPTFADPETAADVDSMSRGFSSKPAIWAITLTYSDIKLREVAGLRQAAE